MTTKALIVVDVQNDFVEGGSLAVPGGNRVARAIADYLGPDLLGARARGYDHVVATRDHHIDPGSHFADQPDFIDTWPRHCVVGTRGQRLHPALAGVGFAAIFDKGSHSAAYSGFEGTIGGEPTGTSLHAWLTRHGVGIVDVVGLATDHCVRATALDAARLGYHTTVLRDLTAPVAPESMPRVIAELSRAGVLVLD